MSHPAFIRELESAEDARASAVYAESITGLSPMDAGSAPSSFERVRVLNEQGGLNWVDPAHLRALGVASGEDEAYLITPRNASCPRLSVSLPELTRFVGANDLIDIDSFERLTAGWDEGILESLAPAFVEEWTLVSVTGSWLFAAWNAGDLSVLAGGSEFIDAYATARPDAPSEVVEWMIHEGETAATDDPELAAVAGLRRNLKHHDFIFAASDLRHYLGRFYNEEALDYLWSAAERVFRSDTRRGLSSHELSFPTHAGAPVPRVPGTEIYEFLDSTLTTSGSADERLVRLMSRDRSFRTGLDEIWSARS